MEPFGAMATAAPTAYRETVPPLLHRCYRNSLSGTFAWKRLMDKNWNNRVFQNNVDAYVSPSREIAETHSLMGLPKERIHIIPNACRDRSQSSIVANHHHNRGGIYIGRLSLEKGVDVLIDAWKTVDAPLTIIGTGPEEDHLRKKAAANPSIKFLGHLPQNEAADHLARAAFLVFPNRWAEPFGLSIIEAMAAGRPVIASKLGAPAEIIQSGYNGLIVPPENPRALRTAIDEMIRHPRKTDTLGQAARQTYLARYTPEIHADRLECLLKQTIDRSSQTPIAGHRSSLSANPTESIS